jgi:DNA replication protein DnaC
LAFNTCGDPVLEGMLAAAVDWIRGFRNNERPRWISFLGDSGTGKTHLGSRCFNFLWRRTNWRACSYIGHVVYWPDFVQRLRSGESFGKRDDMKRWPVLMLDDIGAERDTTGFASEELNTLLGCRGDKWTILTANVTLQKLAQIDQRIASRVVRGKNIAVQCNTCDYALRAKA